MARSILLFFLSFWQLMAQAQAPGPLRELAFLKDPQAQWTLEQAMATGFQRYDGPLRLGFQPGAVWIRLTLEGNGAPGDATLQRQVLRVGPHNLERIELLAPADGTWVREVRGALTPSASRHCPDDMHCFDLETPVGGRSTAYLRIEHRGFLLTQVEVLPAQDLPQAVAERIRGLTTSLVVALGLLVLGLALLLVDRSRLLLVYCGFQLTVVVFIASNAGLLATVFPSAGGPLLSLVNTALYVLRGAMTGLLAWTVLQPHGPSRLHQRGGHLVAALCGISALALLAGQVQLALQGALVVLSLVPFWLLYGILTAERLPPAHRRVLIVGTSIYIVMLTLGLWLAFAAPSVAPRTGLIRQIADWRLNGLAVGLLFFWLTMMERSGLKRARAREVETLRHQALEARARQAELDERTGLIDMLTHELKNPIGTIRFAVASLRQSVTGSSHLKRIQSIDLSARRMDDLIERVASFSKVERSAPPDNLSVVDLGTLVQGLLADASRPEQWDVRVPAGLTVRGDRQLLWVILENLMSNADKYSLPDHRITLTARLDDDGGESGDPAQGPRRVSIDISNAVDPACLPDPERLFDRYYRHPHVQGLAGMGLGLSIVKSAAQKTGGDITYREVQGRAVFTWRVPA